MRIALTVALVGCGRINFDPVGGLGDGALPTGSVAWALRFGGVGSETPTATAFDTDGDVLVAGSFNGPVDFGLGQVTPQASDGFVLKIARDGSAVRWVRQFVGLSGEIATDMTVRRGGGALVVGYTTDGSIDFGSGPRTGGGGFDAFIAAYDSDGTPLWSRVDGDSGMQVGISIATSASEVVVTGNTDGTISFGGTAPPISGTVATFGARLAPDGGGLSAFAFGNNVPYSTDVAVEDNGTSALVGSFINTVDVGIATHTAVGGSDAFVVGYQSLGNPIWSRAWGDISLDSLLGAATDGTTLTVVGAVCGTIDVGNGSQTTTCDPAGSEFDMVIARYELATGAYLWSVTRGNATSDERALAVAALPNGFAIGGQFEQTLDFGDVVLTADGTNADAFISLYDGAGTPQWTRQLGSSGVDITTAVAIDDRGVVAVGLYAGEATIAGQTLPFAGGNDMFVVLFGE